MISLTAAFHIIIISFMVFFSLVVAPAVFKTLSQKAAGAFLRVLFPRMFIFGLILSLFASAAAAYEGAKVLALLSIMISTGFALNAYVVTPIINKYRDRMMDEDSIAEEKFRKFHFLSVSIFLAQLITCSYVVISLTILNNG